MLAQFYLPTIGGEERHIHDLSIELMAQGHDVAVATLWQEGTPTFECYEGVRIYRIKGSLQRAGVLFTDKERRHAPPFPDPEVLWRLRRVIMHERPDIVHAHNWMVHSFTPLKEWSGAKLVMTLHDTSLVCAQKRFMCHGVLCSGPAFLKCVRCGSEHYGIAKGVPTTVANWISARIAYKAVDMFLPVSQAMVEATQLERHGVPYRVIPNFVPDDLGRPIEDSESLLEQLPKENYLLFVGDITPDKGVEVLLRAYAAMETQVPLVLIGRRRPNFPTSVPPNVHVLQSLPHDDVMSAWRGCIFGLVPSICLESFGIVALEAMAMGRPVVSSRLGGLSDIVVDGETGLLVPPGDWRALQQAMQRLLDNPLLRERMGVLAKQRAVRFQAKAVVPRIEEVYQELLHPGVRGRSDAPEHVATL
jgi:glycosyltransferase involved in cell wall biosynthesis